jgi:hypothetical protein
MRLGSELHAAVAQRAMGRGDVGNEVVDDGCGVVELGLLGHTQHDADLAALEEGHLRRRLEEERHAEDIAIEADGAVEINSADEDLAY